MSDAREETEDDADESASQESASEESASEESESSGEQERAGFFESILASMRAERFGLAAWGAFLRETYFSLDRRTLGMTRIFLGYLLVMDIFHRRVVWNDMYSTEGVLPAQLNLQRPQAYGAFTFFNAFHTPGELSVLWVFMLAVATCLLIGLKTRVMQILALILTASMNGRLLLIENGGYVVNNLLAMWTAFLPLGDRFSVDALLASMKRRRERTAADLDDRDALLTDELRAPHVSALGFVIVLQLAAIYFFNVVHKTGLAWKNGTAVHYVLYVDRMVTPLVAHVRDHIPPWAILFMTRSTIFFESALPFMLFSPVLRAWSRRAAIFMINTLHIAFGTSMVLGPFAWSCCVFSTLLFGKEDWALAKSTMRRSHRARVVCFDPRSPGALLVCRLLARADGFTLLSFREAHDLPLGIAIEDPERPGARYGRAAMIADVLAALPLGPLVAWTLRAPGVRHAADAIARRLEGKALSAFFGLSMPRGGDDLPAPSVVRRSFGGVVMSLRELAIVVMLAAMVNQACKELWCIKRLIPNMGQPEALRVLSHKLRYLQGWFMFSPNPVMDDGTIVVDAITVDGRHIDPFTAKEPNFDISTAKSFGLTQIWCDYFNRIRMPGNTQYRDAMKDYMYRLPMRTGRPNDAIVSGEVYWVQDVNPGWKQRESTKLEKVKMFSFENPAAQRR